jgi:hypothetical protein
MQEAPLAPAESACAPISKHVRSRPWCPFRFDRIEAGLQIPDLARFLDANRFPPGIKQRILRAWHAALFRLPLSSRRKISRIDNITRVIYVRQALVEAMPVSSSGGGGAEGGSGTARCED